MLMTNWGNSVYPIMTPHGAAPVFDIKHQSKRLLMTPSVYSVSALKSMYGR